LKCHKTFSSIDDDTVADFSLILSHFRLFAINMACKTIRWVLLKNVHLAPQWLDQSEKKLHSLTPHHGFRLFLTMEINVFEPPPGIRANLLRTFAAVPAARMMKAPSERARLYFLLAWFHAIYWQPNQLN